MNVTTVSTGTSTSGTSTLSTKTTEYKIEMLDDQLSLPSDEDDDDLISSDGSMYGDGDLVQIAVQDDVANQLAAAGPVGVAAAAAIASSKKRKRPHSFETNPSVRKRQQNRLLRKLRGIIYEFTGRVGKQAVVLVATPGKPNTSYKVFGAKPLEDVVRNLKNIVMDELENALAQQAPPPPQEDPTLFELPPLIIDGIPTPVEKMTQAQLRAFIPLMLKYSTGRGKPGWGRESTRPPWWPKELPWANVRMDARTDDDKQKISWTHALRKIVINCYKYHGREDLLPTFADDEDKVAQLIEQTEELDDEEDEEDDMPTTATVQAVQTLTNAGTNTNQVNVVKLNSGTVITTHSANPQNHNIGTISGPTIIQSTNNQHITTTLPASTKIEICQAPQQTNQITQQQQQHQTQQHQQQQQQHHVNVAQSAAAQTITNAQVCIEPMTLSDVDYTTQTVLSTIQNADGTVSLIQVDPNNPIITLPDGTTAQVQGVATLHQGEGGATIQTVQSLNDINGHDNMTMDLTEATVAQDGQIYITAEDGQGYPVSVSNMITVPVSASMYNSMMANIQQIHTNSDGTVCITPMQVDSLNNNSNNNTNSNNSGSSNTANISNSSNNNNNHNSNNSGSSNHLQCYSIVTSSSTNSSTGSGISPRLLAINGGQPFSNQTNLLNNNHNNNNNIVRNNCQIIQTASLGNHHSSQQHQNLQQHLIGAPVTKFLIAGNLPSNLFSFSHPNNIVATVNNNNNNNNNEIIINNNNIKMTSGTTIIPIISNSNSRTKRNRSALANVVTTRRGAAGQKRRKQIVAKIIPIKIEDEGVSVEIPSSPTNTETADSNFNVINATEGNNNGGSNDKGEIENSDELPAKTIKLEKFET